VTLFADFNSSVSVPFQRMRALLLESGGGLQEGVVGAQAAAGDLKVAQRAASANLSADVALGAAWVTIDTGTRNGIGHVFSDATFNAGPFTAGNATNPRVDQVIARWNDTSIPTGAGNIPTIEVLTGTATAGATLDNRLGATALPNDCVRLADVLMPVSASSVTTANIRDRRPWARGAAFTVVGNGAGNHTTVATTAASLAAGAYDIRLECSGATLDVDFTAIAAHNVAGGTVSLLLLLDGAAVRRSDMGSGVANLGEPLVLQYSAPVAPGSHLLTWQWDIVTAGTGTMFNSSTAIAPNVRFREVVRQNASNT
jgi:hypothetical protein